PEVDGTILLDEPFGSVESVKTVSELYAPVSGRITAVNQDLADSPELVNESPFENAWMIEVELTEESDLDKLMSAEEYEAMIQG
ncbi:MAG: glycine cleavage system protein H, partial [Exiguobacterium sp.]|nr:glycine cleavage system protein H [Exiguobacterium sp.]